MSEARDTIYRVRTLIVAVLVVVGVGAAAHGVISARSWIDRPFPGFSVLRNNLVPVLWMPGWPGFERGIKFGDVIVAADGKDLGFGDALIDYVASLEPGTVVTYTVKRRGSLIQVSVPVTRFTLQDYLILFPLITFIGLFFYSIGLVVFYLKPQAPASWAFLSNGVLVGIILIGMPGFSLNHSNIIPLLTLPLIGSSFVALSLYFPETHRWRKQILTVSVGAALPLIALYVYFFSDITSYVVVDTIILIFLSAHNTAAIALVIYSFYTSGDRLTYQRAKIVIYGLTLTGAVCLPFPIGVLILKKMIFFWCLPIGLVILPMSIGYAILATNLFDVDVFIRRSISYVLVSAVAVVMLFVFMGLISYVLQNVAGQSGRISSVLSTLLVVALFRPFHARTSDVINRRFYRQGYEYQRMIHNAGRILSTIIELDELTNKILDSVMEAIKIECGGILLLEKDREHYRLVIERDYSEGPEQEGEPRFCQEGGLISAGHPLVRHLEEKQEPLQRNEISDLHSPPPHRQQMEDFMYGLGYVLVIPIVYEQRLVGMMGLGPKRSGAWYTSEDIELLHTLMIQTAVSIENARKVGELKKMVELETSYRNLKELDELKDNFLSMVSHDLRTPMTGIKGYAYILQEMVSDEQQKQYLDVIIQQSERLTRLINDLLDFQKFENGKMALEFEDIDLVQLVNDGVDAFAMSTQDKNLTLNRSLPEGRIIIYGNRDRLHQVVANLLSNAFKFAPVNGHVKALVEMAAGPEQKEVKVSVVDDGPGIPHELQSRLFQKFQQVHKPSGDGEKGTGLGLALVRQIVESHQGRVGVNSEPGRGSEFYFVLPLKTHG